LTHEESRIHLAFRFHVNFYHSYRGDSLDERGIGKDIRIIRSLLDDLDALEAEGIPVRCAWDIENYFSLETYLPRHAPDILERIRTRVTRGFDEIELMSWNNGIMTAHTRQEFRAAIGRAIHNTEGSGVADLFPSWAPIVRPQECMFTSAHIPEYRALGVEALSVYYSAIPFNGFGSFIPVLPTVRRYNPMTLVDPDSGANMRLLPACNHADIVEHWVSLRRWLVSMRRDQSRLAEASDLILVIDMDADDTFWTGYLPRAFRRLIPSGCGFGSLVRSVAGLPWLCFTRPWDYLSTHGDLGSVELGQDLADGAWDGYSSWAEKSENAALWSRVARARRVDELAARVEAETAPRPGSQPGEAAGVAMTERLLAMSTTHFGMASPVMNAGRLRDGFRRADAALEAAERRLEEARRNVQRVAATSGGAGGRSGGTGGTRGAWYLDQELDALPLGSGAIATLRGASSATHGAPGLSGDEPDPRQTGMLHFAQDAAGIQEIRAVINPPSSRLVELSEAMSVADRIAAASGSMAGIAPGGCALETGSTSLSDGRLELRALPEGGVVLAMAGRPVFTSPLSRPWIDYGGRAVRSRPTAEPSVAVLVPGRVAELRVQGEIPLPGGQSARWTHVYTMAAGLGGVAVDVSIAYPRTAHRGFERRKAARLDRDWDPRWRTVAPFELHPALDALEDAPARVWKHGFFGQVSSYELGYHKFGPNREQDSLDNHLTNGWVAVSGGGRGLLVAQSAAAASLYAFCPMQTRLRGGRQAVSLNPFGTYAGRQWKYPLAVTGWGRLAALLKADNLDSYGPSWEGSSIRFSLMLAPYEGDAPPPGLRRDALVFATPPERA
jgi:hypothetical protein